MSNSFGSPLFGAIGPQELIAVVFVLVSVIGWIIRTVQGNNQQMPAPVQRPGRRRDERVNDEIDSFLQQVARKSESPDARDRARQTEQQRPEEFATVEPARNQGRPGGNTQKSSGSGNRRPGGQTGQRQGSKPPQQPPAPQPSRRIREENTSRPAALGSSLTQHVRETMGERIAKEAERDIGRDVTASVNQHMGNFLGQAMSAASGPARVTTKELFAGNASNAAPTGGECCGRAESLKKMLRNPESIRQAIIIQEILNRPKSLR